MPQQQETGKKRPNKLPDKLPRGWMSLFWYFLLGSLVLWMWQDAYHQLAVRTIPYSEFKDYLGRKEVTEVHIGPDEIRGRIEPKPAAKEGEAAPEAPPPFTFRVVRVEDPKLVEELQAAGVKFDGWRPGFLSELLWTW